MLNVDYDLIAWLLRDSGVSYYSIGKATGIHPSTIGRIASGTTDMKLMHTQTAAKLTSLATSLQKGEGIRG